MARLILLVPVLLIVGPKVWTWYVKRRTAQLQAGIADAKAARAPRRLDPEAFGLPPAAALDTTRIAPPGEADAVLAAAKTGDWQPAAEFLAAAGDDWDLRSHRLAPLSEAAAQDDSWLKAWRAARPGDPDAALVHADSLIQLAWQIRSAKRAKYVTQEQAEGFHRVLREAVAACREAAELAPADPSPWASQLPIAMGLGWSHEEFNAVWEEIVSRAPHHYGAHLTALQYWCQKWRGSHELMFAFAEKAASSAPPESLLSGLRLRAVHELEITEDTYKSWQTPEAKQAMDQLLADLRTVPADDFRAPAQRHLLAAGLTHSMRYAEAVEQFRLVGPYIDAVPWSYSGKPADLFCEIRNRALVGWDKAGRPAPLVADQSR